MLAAHAYYTLEVKFVKKTEAGGRGAEKRVIGTEIIDFCHFFVDLVTWNLNSLGFGLAMFSGFRNAITLLNGIRKVIFLVGRHRGDLEINNHVNVYFGGTGYLKIDN